MYQGITGNLQEHGQTFGMYPGSDVKIKEYPLCL
jgi:hypothetical protein